MPTLAYAAQLGLGFGERPIDPDSASPVGEATLFERTPSGN